MEFLELAKKRYSVRAYQPRAVEQDKLTKILEAGRVAPTAANCQPQRVIVAQEKAGLDKLGVAANLYGAPLALLVCADHAQAWTRPFDGKQTADIDSAIVTDHMMLEATALGLGSVWICYFDPEKLRTAFDLPAHLEPLHILAIGYAADKPQSPDRHSLTRKPLQDTVSFESL